MQEIHKSLTKKSKSYKKWHRFSGHETYHWLILVVLVVFAGMVIDNRADFLFGDAAPQNTGPQYGQALEQQIPELSKQMLDLAHKLRKASPEERDAVLAELMAVAEERKALVGQAIKENPRAAVNTALNNQLRAQMPQEVRDLIEEKKTVRGTFEWVIGENLETEQMVNEFSIIERGSGKKYMVHLPKDELPNATTDDEVTVQGVIAEDNLAATSDDVEVTQEAGVTSSTQKRLAVILFNFQDKTNQTISIDSARTKYFTGLNSVNAFVKENSFGQIEIVGNQRVDGDVYGWYTLPYNSTSCDRNTWASAAESKAKADGFDLSAYDFVSFVHPQSSGCGAYLGWGTIGGSPGRTWIQDPRDWVLAHEIGHNMGSYHAVSWNCTENGSRVPISNDCKIQDEYGDDGTVMANQNLYHFSAYHKGKSYQHFGWFNASNIYTVDKNLQPDNVYTITPLETSSTGIQALRIQRTASTNKTPAEYYYLEFRQPVGFDSSNRSGSSSFLSGAETNGVLIKLARDFSSTERTKLIDTTPSSGFAESALTVGSSFVDPLIGLTLTVQSVAPEGAKVRVTFGNVSETCTRANPAVEISPSSATGEAGTTLSYTVKVTNRDSAACSQSAFSVAPTNMPSGFLQSPTSFTTPNIAPGGDYSQTVLVTSADTIADGTYSFNERAQNTTATSYVASASANYIVAFVDTQNPQVSLTAPASGSTVSGSVSVTANAADNVGVTSVVFKVGGTTIGQDASSPYSVLWDSSSVSNGAHNVVAVAKDAAGNTAEASVTVTTSNTQTGDTTAPQATIQAPANNSKLSNGQNNVEVSATDNTRVSKIDILLDGNIISTCTGAQTSLSCTARFLGNREASGAHFILVRAYDVAGNVGTAQVNVTK